MGLLAIATALCGIAHASTSESGSLVTTEETWVGHQIVRANREIMVLGKIETQVDAFVLARVRRNKHRIEIQQQVCALEFSKQLGVSVSMSPGTIAKLPIAEMVFERQSESQDYAARPWVVQWGRNDLEGDKKPGATIDVDAGICSGKIYVGSRTQSSATGHFTPSGFSAQISIELEQMVLGASNWCLKVASSNLTEHQRGFLSYRRVNKDTTCQSIRSAP